MAQLEKTSTKSFALAQSALVALILVTAIAATAGSSAQDAADDKDFYEKMDLIENLTLAKSLIPSDLPEAKQREPASEDAATASDLAPAAAADKKEIDR